MQKRCSADLGVAINFVEITLILQPIS